ncbi:MAG: 4Fe-4S dicluster domain-containing protein [Bacteroidales bacterium]|nr:4Fe-4S dicluster domain-containing protein [Bacteroidales bacterium]
MKYFSINKEDWDRTLEQLMSSYLIFATVKNEFGIDYEELTAETIADISYNIPKPATPLKNFFLPVKENVTSDRDYIRKRIIIGVPNCDIEALKLLDEIYFDNDFPDIFYREKRENTVIISSDCFGIQEHCHCTSYGVKPWSESGADLAVVKKEGKIILRVISSRGNEFLSQLSLVNPLNDNKTVAEIEQEQLNTENLLKEKNSALPDYKSTGRLVNGAAEAVWKKYSSTCVSCGACTTICPTCTCFLLIDKEGFEKVKQLDACQYPGFARVAGGEDPLGELHRRFRNRYMCKYVWKPVKFSSIACTGCGRCIEACIGKINKNELFMELAG